MGLLERARELGFLGPGPVQVHIRHAMGFAEALGMRPQRMLDLGSGAGLPGLVLALLWPDVEAVLLEANGRRAAALRQAVDGLGLADRVRVLRARAENAGREPALRERFEVVAARAFAGPAVTAECGSPFLAVGGLLVVAEPPQPPEDGGCRWPASSLAALGLASRPSRAQEFRFQVLAKVSSAPSRFPRRVGIPAKRRLFGP